MTTYNIDRETVWYIETWDVQLEEWHGMHPYTEWSDLTLARQGFDAHKVAVPGGQSRLVREVRSRVIVSMDKTGPGVTKG